MEINIIPDGWHNLEGICTYSGKDQYNEDIDGYILRVDGKNYLAYEDPSDGYRSYSEFLETELPCTTIFPPQRVSVLNYDVEDELGGYNHGVKFFNAKGDLILHIGTENYDDYYPTARSEWHPENLPINQDMKVVFSSKLPEGLAMSIREYLMADQGDPDALSHILEKVEQQIAESYKIGVKDTIDKVRNAMGENFELKEGTRLSDVLEALENTMIILDELEKLTH